MRQAYDKDGNPISFALYDTDRVVDTSQATIKGLQDEITHLTAENERLRNRSQEYLSALDDYRKYQKSGKAVKFLTGARYAIAVDFKEADLRAALQPKEQDQ